jgi:undecaprenyl-diphosphatase
LLAVPIVLVGPSRLYLGQHWLSDVLGGYVLAALCLVPLCWAFVKWRLGPSRVESRPGHDQHDERWAQFRIRGDCR